MFGLIWILWWNGWITAMDLEQFENCERDYWDSWDFWVNWCDFGVNFGEVWQGGSSGLWMRVCLWCICMFVAMYTWVFDSVYVYVCVALYTCLYGCCVCDSVQMTMGGMCDLFENWTWTVLESNWAELKSNQLKWFLGIRNELGKFPWVKKDQPNFAKY